MTVTRCGNVIYVARFAQAPQRIQARYEGGVRGVIVLPVIARPRPRKEKLQGKIRA